MKQINPHTSLFAKAWLRDNKSGMIYRTDALLIALLAHTHAMERSGKDGTIVRELMGDINLEQE